MPRYLHASRVRDIQRTALANGGRLRHSRDGKPTRTVEWNIAGNCQSPKTVELHGRAELMNERFNVVTSSDNAPNFICMEVACRQCENCLKRRAAMWRIRSMSEYRQAARTWLVTFTLSPASVITLLSRARVRLAKGATDYDALSIHDQFVELEREGALEIQKWFKRIRKSHGSAIRYLCVAEAHKSGNPHWHLLLHEVDPLRPLRYDSIKGTWPLGFDAYKLLGDAKSAGYVCKYLSKSMSARVRASLRYGAFDGTEPP